MELVSLSNGIDVPKSCVDALNDFENVWPGASFENARPAIVSRVLAAVREEVKTLYPEGVLSERQKGYQRALTDVIKILNGRA